MCVECRAKSEFPEVSIIWKGELEKKGQVLYKCQNIVGSKLEDP